MTEPSGPPRRTADRLWTVIERELVAAVRTRSYALLSIALLLIVVGVARVGGGPSGGYVPTVVDVLVVVEVLVPAVAFAVGYRAVVDARERGELAVLETYPLPPWAYVIGVYTGRAIALLVVVLGPLVVLGIHVATTAGPETTVFASHRGVDSPLLYVRFLSLTALLALVSLAVALALSAVAGSRRRAIVLGLVGVAAVVAGFDLLVVTGSAQGSSAKAASGRHWRSRRPARSGGSSSSRCSRSPSRVTAGSSPPGSRSGAS
ncbi:hypothetical protein ACFQL1_22095 [Halomicroarcula sp. GCM10025709]|uniref:hypothetical protein n=1 Tax=Halomicroarcula sp. GCM10025709 TaxID=3252669 RepID=UPI003617A16A